MSTLVYNLHSEIIKGLNKNMNVFVEKPLALNHKSIDSIVDAFGNLNHLWLDIIRLHHYKD